MRRGVGALVVATFAASRCSRPSSDLPPAELFLTPAVYRTPVESRTYFGNLAAGEFEPFFAPCGTSERWYFDPSDLAIWRKIRQAIGPEAANNIAGALVFVRLRGRVYGPGRFGHHDEFVWRLDVDSIVDAHLHVDSDCAFPRELLPDPWNPQNP